MKHKEKSSKLGSTLWKATMLLLMLTFNVPVTGCATRTVVIPSDRAVVSLRPGQSFIAPCAGKFVPLATYLEMQDALIRESQR